MIIYNVSFQSRAINKAGTTISAIIVQMILCWSHIVGRRRKLMGSERATLRVQTSFLNLPTDPHPDHHNPPHREQILNHLHQPIAQQEHSHHNAPKMISTLTLMFRYTSETSGEDCEQTVCVVCMSDFEQRQVLSGLSSL